MSLLEAPSMVVELDGWRPVLLPMVPTGSADEVVAELLVNLPESLAGRLRGLPLAEHPVVREVRRLFRAAGCDPTRYRPSSEALARRLLKRQLLPSIHPLVDLNNLLSVRLLVPCCVMDGAAVQGPLVLRAGRAGERMESMRGAMSLEGKPVLADEKGPLGTPISDSTRVMVTSETSAVLMVVYLTASLHPTEAWRTELEDLLERAPVATLGR